MRKRGGARADSFIGVSRGLRVLRSDIILVATKDFGAAAYIASVARCFQSYDELCFRLAWSMEHGAWSIGAYNRPPDDGTKPIGSGSVQTLLRAAPNVRLLTLRFGHLRGSAFNAQAHDFTTHHFGGVTEPA